ncbi:hypothetical protein AB0I72_19215 [Nocardiopsis sp. NPDC049922]|uniref:hypothetical protein n=1 Tax=Nocardiopsis sp. NPDC049922 TaxID=3155157 RepID=UPI00340185BD
MSVIPGTRKLGSSQFLGLPKPAVGFYDFDVDGGAVSTIPLRGDTIPSGAIIVDSLLQVDTVLAGGTGTDDVSIDVESAGDIQAAGDRTAAPWDSTGAKRGSLTATSAPVATTAERSIAFTIAGSALTAGAFRAVVWYVELV